MDKLGFKETEEPEIKFLTFFGSWRKQRNSSKTSTSALLTTWKPLTVGITANIGCTVEAMVFPVVMYRCERKLDHQGWALKNWCFQIVVLEKMFESLLDCKEIKPVNPKENQPWVFIGRTVAEADTPIFWPPDGKSRLFGKALDAWKD